MELREKIVDILVGHMPSPGYEDAMHEARNVANDILDLPEIKEALARPMPSYVTVEEVRESLKTPPHA